MKKRTTKRVGRKPGPKPGTPHPSKRPESYGLPEPEINSPAVGEKATTREIQEALKREALQDIDAGIDTDIGDLTTTGPHAALAAIQNYERILRNRLQKAIEKKDVIAEAILNEQYFPVVESLRRISLAVERDKREIGENIEVGHVQDVFAIIGYAINFAEEGAIDGMVEYIEEHPGVVEDKRELREVFKKIVYTRITESMNQAFECGYIPSWATVAIATSLNE